jgi:hypothetical protein
MGVLLPELAPIALRALLVPLMRFAGFVVALGVIYMLHHFVRATVGGIAGIIGHVWGIGPILSSPVNKVYHWMDHEFGVVENFLDAQMAAALHQLARLVESIGHQLRAHSELLWALATLANNPFSVKAWRVYFSHVLAIAHGVQVEIRHAGVGYIGAAIHLAVAPLNVRLTFLDKWIHSRVTALDHAIDVTIPKDVAGLRVRTKTIEGELSKVWDAIRTSQGRFAAVAFAGAVALALDRIGLRWLKCSGLKSLGNRMACGGWRILDDLLAGIIDVLVIADLCQLTKLLISVTESSEVQGVLSGIIGGIDELLLCQGVARPPALDGYWTAPPPLQAFAALPAV